MAGKQRTAAQIETVQVDLRGGLPATELLPSVRTHCANGRLESGSFAGNSRGSVQITD